MGRSGAATVADGRITDDEAVATLSVDDCSGVANGTADETGGSSGVSSERLSSSECKPTGLRGRRSVPLLARGVIPIESQMML